MRRRMNENIHLHFAGPSCKLGCTGEDLFLVLYEEIRQHVIVHLLAITAQDTYAVCTSQIVDLWRYQVNNVDHVLNELPIY
jgi:hypothetical protein